MKPTETPAIRRGLTTQLAARRARVGTGETPRGRKLAFGAPATRE